MTMNKKNDVSRDSMIDSVQQRIQEQILKQSPNLPDTTVEEIKVILEKLKLLPFKDDKQRTSLFKSIQCLQGYHIIQIFNVGVFRLQQTASKSSKCMAKILSLFELCSSFCYTTDVSERVSFECYLRALKLCFPSDPKKCHLSTEIISMLLELVVILQEENLCVYPSMDLAKPDLCLKGARDLFNELLSILESRFYDESDVVEIINQALRLAKADAKSQPDLDLLHLMKDLPESPFQFDQAKPAVFLKNWIDLLHSTREGDAGFITRVADEDTLQRPPLGKMSPLCYFVNVLKRMKENGDQVDLSYGEKRMKIFFRNMNHLFVNDYQTTVILLKMFSFKDISDAVLAEVYRRFLSKWSGERPAFAREEVQPLESIKKLLFVLNEGGLVVRVLTFWNEVFPNDWDFTALKRILNLFTGLKTKGSIMKGVCVEGKAERLFKFITRTLRSFILPSIHFWAEFLGLLISIFPTSFDKIPVVVSFIENAVQILPLQTEALEYRGIARRFLTWLSNQSCSEKLKEDMIVAFMHCVDPMSGCNLLSVHLIKSLGLCEPLPLHCTETFIQEMVRFSKHFEPYENDIIRGFVCKVVSSSEEFGNPQEIFTELSYTIKNLWEESQIPLKSTRVETFQLISLLGKAPLSSLTKVRLLQLSRNSHDGLSCCLRYLQLSSSTSSILKERSSEYFELLFAAMFETLNGNKNLCESFYPHHCSFTSFCTTSCPSVAVLKIWSTVVAGLFSLDLFREDIDSKCCMPVLASAKGFDSEFQGLLLYFQLRSVFSGVIRLLTRRNQRWSFDNRHGKAASRSYATPNQLLGNLTKALSLIVQSDIPQPENKLILIDKVYEIILSNPHIMAGDILPSALRNIIPFNQTNSHEDNVSFHLEIQHIITILERPGMLKLLANVPSKPSQSLCSVLCSKIPNPLSKDDAVEIYDCVASLKDAKKEFFHHLLPLLESITKMCSSMSDVRDLLMEAEAILRQIRPELIPLLVLTFSYLVENNVTREQRGVFIELVALKWESHCDLRIFTDYEIPQLLWKAYRRANSAEGKYEAIDQIHEVVVRSKDLETSTQRKRNTYMDFREVQKSVACRDLEWLVLDSSLSCEDVALCFHLSSCYPGVYDLKCFSSSVPLQQNEPISRVDHGAQDPFKGLATRSETLSSLLTPAVIAHKMIVQLRRLLGDGIDLRHSAVQLWNSLFTNQCLPCPDAFCKSSNQSSTCDKFVNVFLSVLEKAPYLEVVFAWFSSNSPARAPNSEVAIPWFNSNRSQHQVIQYSKVILESCGWNGENVDKEGLLQIHAEVIATLTILASVSRLLQPQLECLHCILQKRLPFAVTTNLLKLARIDWQAAVAITAIASRWSSPKEANNLLIEVQRLFNEGEICVSLPQQRDFVWLMLEACGRVYIDSSNDLLERLDCLINFPDELEYGFNRLPEWRKLMTEEGFPAQAVDRWCVHFLFTPRKNVSSRDVDAILDLSPSSLQLVAPASQSIRQCIFPEDFQTTQREGSIKDNPIKERLRLARLLNEFVHILKLRKPKKASSDAAVTRIVVSACDELCKSYSDNKPNKNLYKIHRQKLQDLFTKVFGNQPTSSDENVEFQDEDGEVAWHKKELRVEVPDANEKESVVVIPETHENGSRLALPETHENESRVVVPESVSRVAPQENNSRVPAPDRHENKAIAEMPEAHENESRVKMPEADENKAIVEVPEVHENKTIVEMPEVHENKAIVKMPEVHENKAIVEMPEVHENKTIVEMAEAHENESRLDVPVKHENERKVEEPVTHRQEKPPSVLKRVEVYEPMLVLLRRWLSSISDKPILASLTLDVVKFLLSQHSTEKGPSLLQEMHHKILPHILHLPANQILISQLQAAGYNQGDTADNLDLWASPSVELACYLSKRESPGEKTFERKLTNVLRHHWMEWKNLLFMLNTSEISVGETKMCTKDLFGFQASLKEMENQVAAVKKSLSQVQSEDVERRVKQLIRQEQRHRSRIKELYKSNTVSRSSYLINAFVLWYKC